MERMDRRDVVFFLVSLVMWGYKFFPPLDEVLAGQYEASATTEGIIISYAFAGGWGLFLGFICMMAPHNSRLYYASIGNLYSLVPAVIVLAIFASTSGYDIILGYLLMTVSAALTFRVVMPQAPHPFFSHRQD